MAESAGYTDTQKETESNVAVKSHAYNIVCVFKTVPF